MVQLSVFQDDGRDAIIAQFLPLVAGSSTVYSVISNVVHVRARGAELVGSTRDLVARGLEMTGSVTYVDARTLALTARDSATAPAGSAVEKLLPNTPRWRGSGSTTYRPNTSLALTVAGRYSGKM